MHLACGRAAAWRGAGRREAARHGCFFASVGPALSSVALVQLGCGGVGGPLRRRRIGQPRVGDGAVRISWDQVAVALAGRIGRIGKPRGGDGAVGTRWQWLERQLVIVGGAMAARWRHIGGTMTAHWQHDGLYGTGRQCVSLPMYSRFAELFWSKSPK
eukprot:363864-Chlamydomonas_euryale.AAC.21